MPRHAQGYTDNILSAMHASSYMSSERQLHFVLSQLTGSTEIQNAGMRARMETIIKGEWVECISPLLLLIDSTHCRLDLENPHSVTSKTLREIPAFFFAI